MSDDATTTDTAAANVAVVLEALARAGIHVELQAWPRGSGPWCDAHMLRQSDAIKVLGCGIDRFWADTYGVSVGEFRRWRDHSGNCSGRSKRGQCCNMTAWWEGGYPDNCPTPGKFVWGVDDRCEHHGGPARKGDAGKKDRGPFIHAGLVGSSRVLCGFVLAEPIERELSPTVLTLSPWSKKASDFRVTTDVRDVTCTRCCASVDTMRSRHAAGTRSHAALRDGAATICGIELKTALPALDTVGVVQPVVSGKPTGGRIFVVVKDAGVESLITCPVCLGHDAAPTPDHVLFAPATPAP